MFSLEAKDNGRLAQLDLRFEVPCDRQPHLDD